MCFGFDVKRPFDPVFGASYEVIYQDSYPDISLLDLDYIMAADQNRLSIDTKSLDDFCDRQLYTKAKCWSYEKEVRFHRHPEAYGVGALEFRKQQLKSIILGCNMGENVRKKIIKIARSNYPDIQIYQAILSDQKYQLKIDEVER